MFAAGFGSGVRRFGGVFRFSAKTETKQMQPIEEW